MDVSNQQTIILNREVPNNELGLDICKLCGALAADGTIYKQNKIWNGYPATSYYFELTDEYNENLEILSEWINRIIDKKGSIKPNKGSFRFRIGSKKLIEFLNGLGFPLGDKTSIIFIPSSILSKNQNFRLAFIAGALMFDGSVKLDGTVEFSSISKKLRDQIVGILKQENIHVWEFERRATKWSNSMKYGFSSRSFDFFNRILEGPKKKRLELIKYGSKLTFDELIGLFPERNHAKVPFLREIYFQLKKEFPNSLSWKEIKKSIEKKYNLSVHRNTIFIYLNILVKSSLIKRIQRRYVFATEHYSA